jgi:molecular chaperone GrpE
VSAANAAVGEQPAAPETEPDAPGQPPAVAGTESQPEGARHASRPLPESAAAIPSASVPTSSPADAYLWEFPTSEEPEAEEPPAYSDAEVEAVLDDFRHWLRSMPAPSAAGLQEPATIDLHTVLSHFTALRQEVNLQTRSVRAQQEQSGEVLRRLEQSLELLSRSQARSEQMATQALEEQVRPALQTLTELYDALSLASREVQRGRDSFEPLLATLAECENVEEGPLPHAVSEALPSGQSFLARWLLSPAADAALRANRAETHRAIEQMQREREARKLRVQQAQQAAEQVRSALAAIVTGYTMSLQRIDRTLRQHGLEAIPTGGEPFNPDWMEAVEAVPGTGRPANEVVSEVRRGYRWNGRLFRVAQVRVARG